MFTMIGLEVETVFLLSALFLLMLIPIPGLSRLVSKIIFSVERFQFHGISCLFILTGLALFLFIARWMDWYQKDRFVFHKPEDVAGRLTHDAKRLRHERDMYIHALLFVLLASLLKMVRLQAASKTDEKKTKTDDKKTK
jgi:hypothetical protein